MNVVETFRALSSHQLDNCSMNVNGFPGYPVKDGWAYIDSTLLQGLTGAIIKHS